LESAQPLPGSDGQPNGIVLAPLHLRAGTAPSAIAAAPRSCKHGTAMDIDELRKLCHAWPGVTESVKWEDDLVFSVASKMFVVTALRGPHKGRMSFKVDTDRFLELTDQPGMMPAPYMARAFWVSITEPERFADAQTKAFVRRSYELVRSGLSKKLHKTLADV
jgi:predicted DNA-binding protein (MmcQ/YjbR family)